MFAGGLILSITLLCFSVWLFRTERLGWPNETHEDAHDRIYLNKRARSRRRVNALFFLCGLMILMATLATPDRRALWIGCWIIAMLVLWTIMALAGLDVLRTMLHHRGRIDRMRKERETRVQ